MCEIGQQPLSYKDRSGQVVFNGEVCNYHELRTELESKVHLFSTSNSEATDSLFEEERERSMERLRGMFLVNDSVRRKLHYDNVSQEFLHSHPIGN